MTRQEVLSKFGKGEISQEEADKLLEALAAPRVDITKPRVQKDGKICVMPGTTFTGYQLVRTAEIIDELLAMVESQLTGKERTESKEGRPRKGEETGESFDSLFVGNLLVAYNKPEHVEHVRKFFASRKSRKSAAA